MLLSGLYLKSLLLLSARVYGDVFSLKIFNQTIIVINTPTLVREVIDKRSLSSANRPKSILADMITPNNMNMGTGRFGELALDSSEPTFTLTQHIYSQFYVESDAQGFCSVTQQR